MPHSTKVAAVQITPITFKMRESVSKVCDYIDEASKNDAKFIVFPEMAIGGYPGQRLTHDTFLDSGFFEAEEKWASKKLFDISEPIPGPSVNIVCKKAKSCGVYVVTGFAEADPLLRGIIYNTAVLIDPKGNIIGKHRKLHTGGLEYSYWKKGDANDIRVFDTSLGRVGLAICYDVVFPEYTRLLDLMGEEIQCEIWACRDGQEYYCDHYPIVRASEAGIFVISSNIAGKEEVTNLVFKGHSMIVDPFGRILAKAGEEEETIYADINLDVIRDYRTSGQFTLGVDRRDDLYSLSLQTHAQHELSKDNEIKQRCIHTNDE